MDAKKKILIIDDEPGYCEFIKGYLDQKGLITFSAQKGREGIEKTKVLKPHLVLLDLNLPDLDGIKVLERIREIDKDIRVIMITGYGTAESAIEAIQLDIYDHIGKPIELEKLFILIKEALK